MTQSIAIAHIPSTRIARVVPTVARVLLGLLFLVMGLNALLRFLPEPASSSMPAGALALNVALATTGYFVPLLGLTQAVSGALLLANRYVALALTLLGPVVVNIVAYHAFLAPQGLPIAIVVLALEIGLAAAHRSAFRALLAARS